MATAPLAVSVHARANLKDSLDHKSLLSCLRAEATDLRKFLSSKQKETTVPVDKQNPGKRSDGQSFLCHEKQLHQTEGLCL